MRTWICSICTNDRANATSQFHTHSRIIRREKFDTECASIRRYPAQVFRMYYKVKSSFSFRVLLKSVYLKFLFFFLSRFVKLLTGYYELVIVERCRSVDLDPLDHCRAVNCPVKYNGRRNFFNRKLQRCQPVPICIANTAKELPDVVSFFNFRI